MDEAKLDSIEDPSFHLTSSFKESESETYSYKKSSYFHKTKPNFKSDIHFWYHESYVWPKQYEAKLEHLGTLTPFDILFQGRWKRNFEGKWKLFKYQWGWIQ